MIHLESVLSRSRAAALQRAVLALSGRPLPAAVVSADDVPELVQEILDLRHAVAARPIAGQALTLREAVRTEVISMCAEQAAMVDAVRALHTPVTQERVFCAYMAYDRPECEICYPGGIGVGEGHQRLVCSHCHTSKVGYTDEPAWPCATAKLLEPAGEKEP